MLPLFRKDFPSSKDELTRALDEALRRFVQKSDPIVHLRARVFPYVDEIAINLDGAQFDSPPPPWADAEGETKVAFEAAVVTVSGRKISVRGVPMDFRMKARDVVFHKGKDATGEALLLVQKARDGQVSISAAQVDLEEAIARIGEHEARRHGIVIEHMRLAMRARGPRSLAADLRIEARKFLVRANIDIYGQLDIDEQFVAKISQLKCKSGGAIGSLACNALDPFLQQLNDKSFSLKSLPLGEIQPRDIHLAVGDTIGLTVDFGSA